MSAKRDKFPKGRRSKPLSMGKIQRKRKTAGKTAVRKTRKQKDVKVTTGGKRHVSKSPRRTAKT